MSDPKFYCCAEDLAIGYGKTPLINRTKSIKKKRLIY